MNNVFECSLTKKMQKPQKIELALANIKYANCLQATLVGILSIPKSYTISFTPTINHCCDVGKELEILISLLCTINY